MQTPLHVPPRPLGDTVHEADLRLGSEYRQPTASACFSDTWRFYLCSRVLAVCMPLLFRGGLMHDACCCYPVSQNIVNVPPEGLGMGHRWLWGNYTWPLPVIRAVVM